MNLVGITLNLQTLRQACQLQDCAIRLIGLFFGLIISPKSTILPHRDITPDGVLGITALMMKLNNISFTILTSWAFIN